ncbi:signal peptide peptidase SppA [Candidatus Babeliales bacterium]|nr:signal peptide peptidase SppA [Candidatus Babeliales bacterium]
MKKILAILVTASFLGTNLYCSSEENRGIDLNPVLVGVGIVGAAAIVGKVVHMHKNTYVGCVDMKGFIGDCSEYTKLLESYVKNDYIKAILFRFDSPGGIPAGAEMLAKEIRLANKKKPVIALVNSLCASAAYHIASACDYIVAPRTSTVGSIGVFMQYGQFKETPTFYQLNGAGLVKGKTDVEKVQAGKYKTIGDPFKEVTAEERKYLQNHVNDVYETFCQDIVEGRSNLDLKNVKEWADGQIFSGKQAKEIGLVDENGNLSDAKAAIVEILKKREMPHKGEVVLMDPAQGTILQTIFGTQESFAESFSNLVIKVKDKINAKSSQNSIIIQ